MSDTQGQYRVEPRDLAVVDAERVSVASIEPSPDDMKALRETIGKDCNDAQFRVFILAARHLGLDAWARQVVPIVQGGRMTVQTTIDGFRRIAERSRLYGGQVGPFWCGPDGEWRDVWLSDTAPVAAKVGVIRRDFAEPMWGVARTKAYVKGGQWTTMPDVMIAKVAESIALRKAFPAELSGAYSAEELDQARREEDEAPFVATARITETSASEPFEPASTSTFDPTRETATEKQLASIRKLYTALGKGEPRAYPHTMQQAKQLIAALSEQYRAQQGAKRTGQSEPSGNRSNPAPSQKTAQQWNGLADAPLRQRLNKLNYRTVAQVQKFLTDARGYFPNKPDGSREQALAYLESVERDAERARHASTPAFDPSDADVYTQSAPTDGEFEPPADDHGDPGPSAPANDDDELPYDLRHHPKLAGGVTP